MPLRHPAHYPDKTGDWYAFYRNARRDALRPLITPALLAEHAEDPRGHHSQHSTALQDVLNFLHEQPIDGKFFAYAEVPHQRYRVGRLRGRGRAADYPDARTFPDEQQAVHAVFLDRLIALGLLDAREAAR